MGCKLSKTRIAYSHQPPLPRSEKNSTESNEETQENQIHQISVELSVPSGVSDEAELCPVQKAPTLIDVKPQNGIVELKEVIQGKTVDRQMKKQSPPAQKSTFRLGHWTEEQQEFIKKAKDRIEKRRYRSRFETDEKDNTLYEVPQKMPDMDFKNI